LYGLFLDRINDGTDAFCCADGIGEGRAGAISCRIDNKGKGSCADAEQEFKLIGRD
jgi:hypothetical protein